MSEREQDFCRVPHPPTAGQTRSDEKRWDSTKEEDKMGGGKHKQATATAGETAAKVVA